MHNWLATFFLFCYWKFKPPHCLWLRHLWRIYATYIFLIESTGSVRRCFRSEHESDNPIPRVLLRVCVSEGTNQAPFSINKLCHFHIRQWVGVGMVEAISVTTKWVSDTFAYRNQWQKPFGYLCVKKLIYSEGTLQHLLLLFNICLLLI